MDIPAITTDQMREVDRLMIEEFHIDLKQMMENAGRNLADLARDRFLDHNPLGKSVHILVGSGGNGGGGMVVARMLHNWGATISVYLAHDPSHFKGMPAQQLRILNSMNIPTHLADKIDHFPQADLLIDAIIGYSLRGDPIGTAKHLIQLTHKSKIPILSIDTPSGVHTTTGERFNPHINASATMTLALPKKGLLDIHAKEAVGELYLADISVPPELYTKLGISVGNIFSKSEIIQITSN